MKGATARTPGVANWAPSGVWEIQPLLGKLSWPRTANDPQRGSYTSPPPPGAPAEAPRVRGAQGHPEQRPKPSGSKARSGLGGCRHPVGPSRTYS